MNPPAGLGRIRQQPTLVAKMTDHDLWIAAFEDGEGNTLALMGEVPRPPAGGDADPPRKMTRE